MFNKATNLVKLSIFYKNKKNLKDKCNSFEDKLVNILST